MPELVCLSLPIGEVEQRLRLPAEAATREWCAAWREQCPGVAETVCFLCDRPVEMPPRSLILPDYVEPRNRLMAPLCEPCCALPTMTKYGRATRLLRKMYKARTGKNLNLIFNAQLHHRHPW